MQFIFFYSRINKATEFVVKHLIKNKKNKKYFKKMLTNKNSCNIIIHDSKRVGRSLKTEHERIKRTTNAISKVKTKITKLRQNKQ